MKSPVELHYQREEVAQWCGIVFGVIAIAALTALWVVAVVVMIVQMLQAI